MSTFTGTIQLVRLALRRDRVKLPVWVVIIVALFASTIPAVKEIYAADATDRIVYATTNAASIITRVLAGPMGGADLGAIVLNESYLFVVVLIAFMSTLSVVRHTRQNEETGRAELIGSAVVGRHALLTAALLVTISVNVFIAGVVALVLIGGGLPVAGSIATGTALCGTGIVFAAVAAVAAQLFENSRSANALSAQAIGVAFALRAIGDGIGTVAQQGTAVQSAWPSYLSPIGWGEQVFPYTGGRWWLLALYPAACIALVGIAFFLTSRRDVGMGMVAPKPGPAVASSSLLSSFGLAWRLQKTTLFGWMVGMGIFGITTGLMAKEFRNLVEQNETFAEAMKQLGGSQNASEALLSALLLFAAIAISGYAIQALQRLRSEEVSGHIEPVLATGVSRYRWMSSHVLLSACGVIALMCITGIGAGSSYVLAIDASWSQMWPVFSAVFVHMPAVIALSSFAILVFGVIPRAFIILSWSAFGVCIGLLELGALLHIPQIIMDVSPFTHTPSAPAQAVTALPLVVMGCIDVVLVSIGLVCFRRRDITI